RGSDLRGSDLKGSDFGGSDIGDSDGGVFFLCLFSHSYNNFFSLSISEMYAISFSCMEAKVLYNSSNSFSNSSVLGPSTEEGTSTGLSCVSDCCSCCSSMSC